MADPRLRQIKIKTSVVKRLAKDKTVYEAEAEQQKTKIQKYKDEGKDEYFIRKQEEVLQESLMMVPDCLRRFAAAHAELASILESEIDLKDTSDYLAADAMLKELSNQLPENMQGV